MRLSELCKVDGADDSAAAPVPQGDRRAGSATTSRAMRSCTQVARSGISRSLAIALVCLIGAAAIEAIAGEVLSADEIVKALTTTTGETRTRGITVAPRPDSSPGAVNLDIPFGLNSDQLQPSAIAQLYQLAQALRSEACSAVLGWANPRDPQALRRLQLAAEQSASLAVLFRPLQAGLAPSPAVLRLALLDGRAGLQVRIVKSRGGHPATVTLGH